jgi:L-fucose mutarotase
MPSFVTLSELHRGTSSTGPLALSLRPSLLQENLAPVSAAVHTVRHGLGSLMLKGLDPLLNADILAALRSMGHGDELVISDANFPADSIARQTVLGHVLRMDGVDAPRAVRAILSVLPLDSFVEHPAMRMEVVDAPNETLPVHREVQAEIDRAEGKTSTLAGIERMSFYERAKGAYCVIATGERRFYGCFILKKGVIPPAEEQSRHA